VYLLLLLLLFWISLSLGKILRTSLETLSRWGVKLVMGIARGYLTLVDTSLAGSFSHQSHPAKAGKSVGVAANRQRPPCRYGRRRHLCVRLFRPHWLVVAARGVSCRSARRSRDTPLRSAPGPPARLRSEEERGHPTTMLSRSRSKKGRCSPGEHESAVYEGRGSQLNAGGMVRVGRREGQTESAPRRPLRAV